MEERKGKNRGREPKVWLLAENETVVQRVSQGKRGGGFGLDADAESRVLCKRIRRIKTGNGSAHTPF